MDQIRQGLTAQQQIVHYAMFMPVAKLPEFPPSISVAKLSEEITALVNAGIITGLSLDKFGDIQVRMNMDIADPS